MQIIPDLRKYKAHSSRPVILALGNFDGFHLGHQKLLRYVAAQARRHHGLAAVLTFPEHPHSILHPDRKPLMLTSVEQKLFYIKEAGIDLCFLQSFTPVFAKITPADFVKKFLVEKIHVREICMGSDAHFGRDRAGDTKLMERLAKECGFLFREMKPVIAGRKPVSSSRIRSLLIRGEIKKAGECLGRPFSVLGKVVRGKGHGNHLGFPTANLEVHSDMMIPLGVYIASGRFFKKTTRSNTQHSISELRGLVPEGAPGKWLPGVMNFGKRPTYPRAETPRPILELHLLNFGERVYGKTIEVALHRLIRPEQKFYSEEALQARIRRDIRAAQRFYRKG